MIKLLTLLTIIVFTQACVFTDSDIKLDKVLIHVETSEIETDPLLSNEQKAEKLALEAEKLVNIVSFMFAYEVAQKALTYDAKNFRAQFISKLLEPQMKLKGILDRTEALMTSNPHLEIQRDNLLKKLGRNEGLKYFYNSKGKSEIKTEAEFQQLIAEITVSYENFRKFISENKSKSILVTALLLRSNAVTFDYVYGEDYNPSSQENFKEVADEEAGYLSDWNSYSSNSSQFVLGACTTEITETSGYKVICHKSVFIQRTFVKIDTADYEILQQSTAGLILGLLIANTYDFTGYINTFTFLKQQKQDLGNNRDTQTKREALNKILNQTELGKLRSLPSRTYLNTLGTDAIAAIRYFESQREIFCDKDLLEDYTIRRTRDAGVRYKYLFNQPICLPSQQSNEILNQISAALNKENSKFKLTSANKQLTLNFEVNFDKFLSGSLTDLKDLNFAINDEGKLVINNNSANGIIPTGNLSEVLTFASNKYKCNNHEYELWMSQDYDFLNTYCLSNPVEGYN